MPGLLEGGAAVDRALVAVIAIAVSLTASFRELELTLPVVASLGRAHDSIVAVVYTIAAVGIVVRWEGACLVFAHIRSACVGIVAFVIVDAAIGNGGRCARVVRAHVCGACILIGAICIHDTAARYRIRLA